MNPKLPLPYRWLRAHGVAMLRPWYFLDAARDATVIEGLRREFRLEVDGALDLVPFARRQDMDTIAGFVVEDGAVTNRVCTVHLTWIGKPERPGWPARNTEASFQDWLRNVMLSDSFDWMNEEDLADITED